MNIFHTLTFSIDMCPNYLYLNYIRMLFWYTISIDFKKSHFSIEIEKKTTIYKFKPLFQDISERFRIQNVVLFDSNNSYIFKKKINCSYVSYECILIRWINSNRWTAWNDIIDNGIYCRLERSVGKSELKSIFVCVCVW